MSQKICSKCKLEQPITNFHKSSRTKDGCYCWCKSCRRTWETNKEGRLAYHRNRYHTKKDLYLDSTYKRFYGITLEDYNTMFATQGGTCKICGLTCGSGRRLAVDHDHNTGTVRGLLCIECNRGLSAFNDNITLFENAIEYLKNQEKGNNETSTLP